MRYLLVLLALAAVLTFGCRPTNSTGEKTMKPQAPETLRTPTSEEIAAAEKGGKVRVVLDTVKGPITVEIDGQAAPIAVANFLNLVRAGFYDGMPFHRVEPGFVIQAGDPTQLGKPDVSYSIPDETSPIKHLRGTIAMARLFGPQGMVPNSASTQFYICLGDAPHLDQMGFTAFGKVVDGLDVIDRIAVGDTITRARTLARDEVAGG